jgi:hypothetical protein
MNGATHEKTNMMIATSQYISEIRKSDEERLESNVVKYSFCWNNPTKVRSPEEKLPKKFRRGWK